VHANYGLVLQALKRPEDALVSYNRALQLAPDFAEGFMNRGNALLDLNLPAEAVASYDQALKLKPDLALALTNRGVALSALGRHQEALTSYDRALQLKPDDPLALNNRANALRDLKRHGESANSFARLIAVAPNFDYAWGYKLFSQLYGCDWSAYDATRSRIMTGVEQGEKADTPFPFLAHSNSPSAQLKCARTYIAHKHPPSSKPLWSGERYRHDRIRIAYLSADFHGHATSYLIAELFELHDPSRFEVWAISFGPNETGEMRERLESSFHRFVNMHGRSDRDVAQLLREQEIDIAIDLKGLTENSRTGIFAHRAAPVQVSYLGYPATMGADYIDYIIADRHVIPTSQDSCYSEKIIRLPDSYQVNDRKRPIAEHTPTRAELSLPNEGVVFCCFNNNYKINPAVFDVWMHLLKRVQPSVLWLLQDNAEASRNLIDEAERRGVQGTRLIFAPRIGLAEHLARHRQADLFLDTLPCNAHTTASDALWAGLPIVTCMGDSFASRVAGSLLHAVGLPE
jgi:protein O-GlcNAc transferase